jgi:hypothetical protein
MAAGTRQAKSVGTASAGGPSAPVPMHQWYAPMVFVSETDDRPLPPFLSCTDGIIRTRSRDSPSTPSLVEPGRASGSTIDLWATSNVFKAGHRIRGEVSSSHVPRFDRNPNTGSGLPRTPNAHRGAHHPAPRAVPLPYHTAHRATIRGAGRGMPQGLPQPSPSIQGEGWAGRKERGASVHLQSGGLW